MRPCNAAALMGVAAFAAHKLMVGILGNSIATLLAIVVGAVIYVILIFTLKAITLEEVASMPGGTKLVKVIRKFVK